MAMKTIKVPKMVNGVPTADVEEIQFDDLGVTSWGPKDKHRLLNTKLSRVDAPFKTTGTAIYTHDVRVPGMLHGRFVTSPFAHAKVTSIDTTAAMKIDGVKAILPVMTAGDEIMYEGKPVVAVAATTPEIALDVARAIVVKYEVLPHVVKGDAAMKPGVAPVVAGRGGRGASSGTAEQFEAAVKTADAVIEAEYRTPILHHCCLETHSCVADYRGGDSANVYVSTQGTFTIPTEATRELGVPATGIVQHMGGGFGSKLQGIGIAGMWACRLSKETKSPVKMLMTRREEFLTAGNGPGSIQKFKAGVTKDGTLVAFSGNIYSLPGLGGGQVAAQPYQYHAGTVFRQAVVLNTHEDGNVPLRAPGHPQASFAMESLMDELAYKIGMDPVEFRKKNVPDDANGVAWKRQLDTGAKAIGWDKRNPTPGTAKGPLVRGMGCAIGAWGGGGRGGSIADLTIGKDGSVVIAIGSQDIGTGTRTYLRAIVAEELGLEMTDIQEKIGNSSYGNASASGGSTTTASSAPVVKDAAYKARVEMSKLVAPLLGADPDAIYFNKGYVMGNGKAITWKQACAAVPAAGLATRGAFQQPLAGQGAHGASFAEVEVDIETGHVRVTKMSHVQDGGLILNRLAVESQINGGMIQSIGMALFEGRVMDGELGVMVNPAFNDYKIPGTMEIPELIPIIDDGDTRNQVIGIAEPGNIPGCGAIANAIYNACGVRVRETPITPDKVLNGLMQLRRVNV